MNNTNYLVDIPVGIPVDIPVDIPVGRTSLHHPRCKLEVTCFTTGHSRDLMDAVQDWYDEISFYNYGSSTPCDSGKVCGHYTQVSDVIYVVPAKYSTLRQRHNIDTLPLSQRTISDL